MRESVSDLLKAVNEIETELKPTNNPRALDWPHAPGRDIVGDAPRRPVTHELTPEQVQWSNIQAVTRAIAKHCFGSAGSETRVSCGAAFTAIVNSTTARDGAEFSLQPLPKPVPVESAPGPTRVWWDRATGGFYLSRSSVPDSVMLRGGVVELVERDIDPELLALAEGALVTSDARANDPEAARKAAEAFFPPEVKAVCPTCNGNGNVCGFNLGPWRQCPDCGYD